MSPTQLTLKEMRSRGYLAVIVEHWNPFGKVRVDMFGFADIYAIHPRTKDRVFIQTTTKANMTARKHKILGAKLLPDVLNSGHRVEIHGWEKKINDAKRAQWMLTVVEILL